MSDTKLITVTNRDSGHVGYTISERGIHRTFAARETKQIPLEELKQLQWVPGGEYILKHLLIVNDRDALSALNMEVEPEYFYTEDDIKKILSPEGTLDQLRDFLDYSPEGGKELIKKLAVEMELPDTRKRKIISEATGFSIDNAINVNAILNAEDAQSEEEEKLARGQRRATPIKESAAPTRRTTPQYKVVTPKN
jgi:hypothetical protein